MQSSVHLNGVRSSGGKQFVLLAGSGLALLVPMALVPALTTMATHLGHSVLAIQFLVSAPAIVSIFSAPLVLSLASHIGKRRTLLSMLTLFGVSGSVGLWEPSFGVLMTSRLLQGFAGGALLPLTAMLIADYFPDASVRARLLGWSSACQTGMAILAIGANGWLVDHYGWGSAFACYLFSFVVLVAAWFWIEEPASAPESVSQGEAKKATMAESFRPLLGPFALSFMLGLALFMMPIQGPFLLKEAGITSATQQGMLSLIPSVTGMLSSLAYGFLDRRMSALAVMRWALGFIGLTLIGMAYAQGPAQLALAYALAGLNVGVIIPAINSLVISRSTEAFRGAALGFGFSTVSAAQFLNPVLMEPARAVLGLRGAFTAAGVVLCVLAAALILLGSRSTRARVRSA